MARSLVVKHEEQPGTSTLLNAFLLIAVLWMIGGAVLAWAADAPISGGITTLAE